MVIAILIASSCSPSFDARYLHGVPAGVELHCGDFEGRTASCVGSDHKTYGCITNGDMSCTTNRIDCAESAVFTQTKHDTTIIYQQQ